MDNLFQREREDLKTRWPRIMALFTCLAMTLVVAQQGGTIAKQRNLIQLLWDDSKALNQIRIKELAKQREKMYLSDPHYSDKQQEKPPAAKPAPKPPAPPAETKPKKQPIASDKPMRVLLRI